MASMLHMISLATTLLIFSTIDTSTIKMAHAANIVIGKDPEQSYEANWADGICYAPIIGARIGDTLEFRFSNHNVYKMPNLKAFEECDFTQAELLADRSPNPTSYTHEITQKEVEGGLDGAMSLFFACGVGGHCYGNQKVRIDVDATEARSDDGKATPWSKFALDVSLELCELVQRGEKNLSGTSNYGKETTHCDDPVVSMETIYGKPRELYSATCLSKPITMTPGGVVNQATFVHFPYPTDRRVLLGTRVWEIVEGDPDESMGGLRSVNVNQLYVHHILGDVIHGAGAESIRRYDDQAAFPLPYGLLTGDFGDVMTFHFIDLRNTADEWLECAECRCADPGIGRIQCCTNCTDLLTPTVDYRLRYNVTWTEISALDKPVKPLMNIYSDIAPALDLSVEFDVPQYESLPESQQLSSDPTVQVLERVEAMRNLFGNTFPNGGLYYGPDTIEIHRCAGHLHIGGLNIRLEDVETGEVICSCDASYGSNLDTNFGFITSVNTVNFDPEAPKVISADQQVRLVTHYNASEMHTGVMGILTLTVLENSGTDIGESEALLNVDICSNSVCDVSKVPSEWCVDELKFHWLCEYSKEFCDCTTFLQNPGVPGCGEVLKIFDVDVSINSVCRKTCGCPSNPDTEMLASSLDKHIMTASQQICHYNSDDCRSYLSNMYSCSQEMPGVDDLDRFVRMAMVEHGSQAVREHAQLGDAFMHLNRLDESSNKVYPCGSDGKPNIGDDGNSDPPSSTSDTVSCRLFGIKSLVVVVVAVLWFL